MFTSPMFQCALACKSKRQLRYEVRLALGLQRRRLVDLPTPTEAAQILAEYGNSVGESIMPMIWRTADELQRLYAGASVDELLAENHANQIGVTL
jgi:hypothetical protein